MEKERLSVQFLLQYKQSLGGFVRRFKTPIFILTALIGVLGFFQNCTTQVPLGTTDYFQALVNSPIFPYEVSLDQVAYMSCSEQDDIFNDGTFFTFRFGAFDTGGIRISPDYRNSIEKVDEEDVPLALEVSAASSRLRLNAAIRTLDNLQLMFVDNENGTEGVEGTDYDTFFPEMGETDLVNLLWWGNPNDYVSNYPAARFIDEARFEGNVSFMRSELMANDLRNFFNSRGGILAVTFTPEGSIFPVGPGNLMDLQDLADSGQAGDVSVPVDPNAGGGTGTSSVGTANVGVANIQAANNDLTRNVFGAALRPSFRQPPKLLVPANPNLAPVETSAGSDMPPRILSGMSDVIIDERTRNRQYRSWSCDNEMAFMIVLPSDAIYQDQNSNTITRCRMEPDPFDPSPDLIRVRQSLYQEDWWVDMRNRCVVPKSANNVVAGSCYGRDSSNQTHPINYDAFETGCGFDHINQGNGLGLCPHFVSICTRD